MRPCRPLIAVLLPAVLAAAACSGSDGSGSGDGGNEVLRFGTTDEITSFNPYLALTLQTGVALGMTYPQLVEFNYSKSSGYDVIPDLAERWEISPDGLRITFHLKPGAKWSDGKPITAEDAVWTVNTTVKFQEGPTGQMAPTVEGVTKAEATDATTVVLHYDQPRSNALDLLASGIPVLPKHVWEPHAGGDGAGLRNFKPEAAAGGMVVGGPFALKEFEQRGTTVYTPNSDFYGEKPNAKAVTLTFYTNADSMLEDLAAGKLDVVESVPTAAVEAVKRNPNVTVVPAGSALQADLFVNSNPRKPRHRELLDPRVKEALALCVDRDEIIDVVFNGHATPVATLVGSLGGEFLNTDLSPRPHDCARGNEILDGLGYTKGGDGVRTVPATGEEPAHRMDYENVTVGQPTAYNVDRTAEILRKGLERLGVKVTQRAIGDETATWTFLTDADCDPKTSRGYTSWDLNLSLSIAEIDPLNTLSGELKSSWCAWNFTGSDNPEYDRLYEQAHVELDPQKRKELIWRLQKIYYDGGATIPLAEKQEISAYSSRWTGFVPPEVSGYNKRYYTAPRPA